MQAFAELLDRLSFTAARNGKLRLLREYAAAVPDPDRGWGFAALTGGLDFAHAKPALVRTLATERVDPELFALSYDFVGDLAETVALIWPERPGGQAVPRLSEVVHGLRSTGKVGLPGQLAQWLDGLDATGRWALLKAITGALRVGVSARLAKSALADYGGVTLDDIEEVWHALEPPYGALFAWLEGRADRPTVAGRPTFRPLMLANPLADGALAGLDPSAYVAEWKWDGIRVQLVAQGGARRLYSRSGDDIGHSFPEVLDAMDFEAVLDGELLVGRDGEAAPFNDLQQRLNRKTVSAKMLRDFPAFVRLYDILVEGAEDLRPLPFAERRRRLEAWQAAAERPGLDLSPLLAFDDWAALAALRDTARADGIEGLMLKRADSAYVAGRPKGPWFKWKRDALLADCVLMYAQRGHGKRSSYYSDYTFGCWRAADDGGEELVPVGKAYFGFTDEELLLLDRWVRNNTLERFGPVRAVAPGLVLEVAFDSVHRSKRHKSGVALRFPRIHRIRWDKPVEEADRLAALTALIAG